MGSGARRKKSCLPRPGLASASASASGQITARAAAAPGPRASGARNFEKRRGTGEKGRKRMAETGAVFDVQPPDPAGAGADP